MPLLEICLFKIFLYKVWTLFTGTWINKWHILFTWHFIHLISEIYRFLKVVMSIVILDLVDSHFCLNQVTLSCCLMTEPILFSFSVYSNMSFCPPETTFPLKSLQDLYLEQHSSRCPLRSLKVLPSFFWPYLMYNNLLWLQNRFIFLILPKNATLKKKKTLLFHHIARSYHI